MEGRGRGSSGEEGSDAAPAASPSSAAEEGMRELSIGGAEAYPERPGVPNCGYYVRNGHCKYGAKCRYHHPRDRSQVDAIVVPSMPEYPERMEQPVCSFFMKMGYCKYGASCKYHHPNQGGDSGPPPLNCRGYPLRLGEKECSHYLKTGLCKFGINCKFHHPDLSFISMQTTAPAFYPQAQSPAPYQYGGIFNWQASRPALFPGSYAHGSYDSMLYTSGMVPVPTYFPYAPAISHPVSSTGVQNVTGSPFVPTQQMPPLTYPYLGPYSTSAGASSSGQNENMFPERPGEPECQYYVKTGDCKYGSSCKYHHPRSWFAPTGNCALSHFGYSSHPGAPPCTFYAQHGSCKIRRTYKFDQPMGRLNYSPSASSLVDVPVPPNPVGSPLPTMALSSSLERRPEFTNEDVSNCKVTILEKTSIELEGLPLSKSPDNSQYLDQSSAQQSSPRINKGQDSEIIGSS